MTERPNIVWITLDSVRRDRTTLGGHHRDTTPRMQALADEPAGQDLSACFAHSQWTLGSSGSILTGTYPSHSRIGMEGDRVPDELTTVPELFRDVGYRTACLSRNSHVSAATGLDRGFDRFEWLAADTLLEAAGPRSLVKYALNIRRHSAGLTPDTAKHATPYLMNDIATRWLDDLADAEPFLFYLHYNEPHRPYYPPLPWLDRYTADLDITAREAADISMDIHRNLMKRVAAGCDLSDREMAALKAMYDAEVAYTDEMVGRLVEAVRERVPGDTVVVVTADHGELFGEHGLLSHRWVLDDALINVPTVVHGADLDVADDDLVQHVDLLQTLLARAGGDTAQLQGIDLDERERDYVVAQRSPMDFEGLLGADPDYDTSRFHSGLLTALRTREFKYQTSGERSELFALPNETIDATDEYPEMAEELAALTESWLADEGAPVGEAQHAEFDDAMRKQLADLGYLE
ncbi:sulfatase [Haloglomus litoreum]|uniref:sulfatase n=1 Tax=Haloglomus litoreum TaxID=3034026 RepID=UPI0023E7BC06|nr:sulfatase [Haloglomus sp. DT116]